MITRERWLLVCTPFLVFSLLASPIRARAESEAAGAGKRTVFDRTNALVVLGLGSAAWISHPGEHDDELARDLERAPIGPALEAGDRYGSILPAALTAAGLLALGYQRDDAKLEQAGRELAAALITAGAVTWALKVPIDAKRPSGGSYSFPSGHAATAFAMAPVFHRRFGTAAGIAAYAMASLTGLARVEEGKHYLHDVLAGAAIGIVAGRSVSRAPARPSGPDGASAGAETPGERNPSFVFAVQGGSPAARLSLRF